MHLANNMERIQFVINCLAECEKLIKKAYFLFDEDNDQYQSWMFDELSIHYFSQLWSNTGCGWAGKGMIVGHAFSHSKNFVAISKQYGVAFVFINRYAYTCKLNEAFNKALIENNLPGYIDAKEGKTELEIIELADEK